MREVTVKEIEEFLLSHGYTFESKIKDKTRVVKGYSSLQHYKKDTLTWVKKAENVSGIDLDSIGVHTYISDKVQLGKDVVIGSNCVLDGEITIGDRTQIMDGTVVINRCDIGHDTVIQPLCVIGIDGFGYFEDENKHKVMVKHHGGVQIGNYVFIGSHTNIARGTLDNTIIEDDVKIAPSTHIGHNNIIEKSIQN